MINTAIILCTGVGLWQLAIGAQSWSVWPFVLLFLVFCKITDAGKAKGKSKRKVNRYGRHW